MCLLISSVTRTSEAEWFTWIICSNAIGDPLLLWLLYLSLLVATMVGSMVANVLYMYT